MNAADRVPLKDVARALWRDRVWPVTVALVAVIGVFRGYAALKPDAAGFVTAIHDIPLLLLSLWAFAGAARRLPDITGRRFWWFVLAAYACWLAVRVWEIGPGRGPLFEPGSGLVRDLLFLGFYLCLVVALELHPDRHTTGIERHLRVFRTAAAAIFSFALLVYFAVLPGTLNAAEYATRVPSFLFYAALDFYLAVRLTMLWVGTRDPQWRQVYGWLMTTAIIWVFGDGTAALDSLGVESASKGPPLLLILQLDFLAAVAAARVQGLALIRRLPRASSFEVEAREPRGLWGGPLVAYLVALPLLHFFLYWVGALDPATRGSREILLLVVIVVLAGLTIFYQLLLRRESERLRVEAQERRRQAQRLEALGQLAAGIAHDFNNLMTVIMGSASFVKRGLGAGPEHERLRADVVEIEQSVRRGAEMVRRLLAFGRHDEAGTRTVDVGGLVAELSRALRRLLPEDIALQVDTGRPMRPVAAGPAAVEQILLNLVTNARDAMPAGGRLRITVRQVELDEARCAAQGWGAPGAYGVLEVSDTGTGMDPEVQRRLFEPFFTTKKDGGGSGLGMAMVADLVRLSRGGIDVQTSPGAGTTVAVYLPLAARRTPAPQPAAVEAAPAGGIETILVVEDEPVIRQLAQRTLESCGYRVLTASDGLDGLQVFQSHEADIALVVSDVVMPRMGGVDLYEKLRQQRPVPFLFTTGYTEREVAARAAFGAATPFLHKPWTVDDLIAKVRDLLDRADA